MATKKRSNFSNQSTLSPWLGIAAIVILLDQLSKVTITRLFEYAESMTVTSFFNLTLHHNSGAAFSFLATESGWQRHLFTAIGVIAVLYIIYLLKKHSGQRLFCWALALIMGGAIGNVIDRIRFGYVVDFLDFHYQNAHFAIFNIADSAICIGAALFILDELRRVRK